MKHFYIFSILASTLFISCSNEVVSETETTVMRLNHYKPVAIDLTPTLIYLVQENYKIGTTEWSNFYSEIEGFEYEMGYVYDLIIRKEFLEYPPQDASSIRYRLEKIKSKKPISENTAFKIQLKSTKMHNPPLFVNKTANGIYKILDKLEFGCSNLCEKLDDVLLDKKEVIGVFRYSQDQKLELLQVITD